MSNIDNTDGIETTTTSGRTTKAKQAARQAGEAIKTEAQSFAQTAQERLRGEAQKRTETATKTLGDFAGAIRRAGDELSQNDHSPAAKLVTQAADGLERLSLSLADKQPEDLLNDVRDFGRKHPMAFIAGGVLVGLALGRFVRSSDEEGATTSEFSSAYPVATASYDESFDEGFDEGAAVGDGVNTVAETSSFAADTTGVDVRDLNPTGTGLGLVDEETEDTDDTDGASTPRPGI